MVDRTFTHFRYTRFKKLRKIKINCKFMLQRPYFAEMGHITWMAFYLFLFFLQLSRLQLAVAIHWNSRFPLKFKRGLLRTWFLSFLFIMQFLLLPLFSPLSFGKMQCLHVWIVTYQMLGDMPMSECHGFWENCCKGFNETVAKSFLNVQGAVRKTPWSAYLGV